MAIVRRRRWAVLASLFLGLGAASAASIVLPKTYKSTAKMEITANRAMPGSESAAKVEAVGEQIRSLSTMLRVVEELKLDAKPDPRNPASDPAERRAAIAKDLVAATRVEKEEPTEGTYYIRIEHSAGDAYTAFSVVQSIVGGYKRELFERPRIQQQAVVTNAQKSVDVAQERETAAKSALDGFEQDNQELLGNLDAQLQTVHAQMSQVEDRDIAQYTEQLRSAEEGLKTEQQYKTQEVREVDSLRMQGLDAELNRLLIRLNELQVTKRYTDEHPEVVSVKKSIADIERQRKDLEAKAPVKVQLIENPLYLEYMKRKLDAEAALASARQQISRLRVSERKLQDLIRQAPPVRNQRQALADALRTATQTLDDRRRELSKAEDRLRSIEGEQQLDFKTVEEPMAPRGPAGPPPALFALGGLVLGGAAGLGLAWVMDVQDRSFRDVDAVAEFLGVPSLGAIHRIETPAEAAGRRGAFMRRAALVGILGFAAAALAGWSVWVGVRHNPAPAAQAGGDATDPATSGGR